MADRWLKWGVIGAARVARRWFVPGVRAGAEGTVVAVASRGLERAGAMARELDIPRAYGSYEELLADPEVDAVYIALPNALHMEWTVRAAQAGKHVLCEKPLARRGADAQRAAAACGQAGVLLAEGFMYRLHPQQARAKALLAEGAVGAPRCVRATFSFRLEPKRRAGADPRMQRDLAGGALMDIGCYGVDVARYLFEAEPLEAAGLQVLDAALGVDTAFAAVLRFPGDRLAVIDCSFDAADTRRYEVVGSEGTLLVERAFNPALDASHIRVTRGAEVRSDEVPPANQFALQADHFARSIQAGRLLPPLEDGQAQARAIEACYRSAETGTTARLG
jgi:predicted dehydrogenase